MGAASINALVGFAEAGLMQLWHGWRSCNAWQRSNPACASLSHGEEATSVLKVCSHQDHNGV